MAKIELDNPIVKVALDGLMKILRSDSKEVFEVQRIARGTVKEMHEMIVNKKLVDMYD